MQTGAALLPWRRSEPMTRYEHVYVLNVMSDDHPGIVAAVTDAVESLAG